MKLTIKYFAAFREATGTAQEDVETVAGTAAALFAECRNRYEGLENYSASLVAINDEMADWEARLSDGDAVLFFPPVAGG